MAPHSTEDITTTAPQSADTAIHVEAKVEEAGPESNGVHPPSSDGLFVGAPKILLSRSAISTVHLINNIVHKAAITDDTFQPALSAVNRAAAAAEADAYLLLGTHPLIARCLFISPSKTYIELEYYPTGNLSAYMKAHHGDFTNAQLEAFACQMLESVAYMHSKGIGHSALRLEAWLVDPTGTLRLSDFNNATIPVHPLLRVPARPSLVLQQPSHCMPRVYTNGPGSTVASDIFALGSSLYELVSRRGPYEGEGLSLADYWKLYQERKFPDTEGKPLGKEIKKCWMGEYGSVQDILRDLECPI